MMSIEEIAATLRMCASGKCEYCTYKTDKDDYIDCTTRLISAMAEECRKIGDDLK